MRCPVCKAENAAGPCCRRCRADLSLLFGLEREERRLHAEARRLAGQGGWEAAAETLGQAEQVQGTPAAAHARAACLLLARDFAGAWRAYQRIRAAERP